jgi:hypothetical protein
VKCANEFFGRSKGNCGRYELWSERDFGNLKVGRFEKIKLEF